MHQGLIAGRSDQPEETVGVLQLLALADGAILERCIIPIRDEAVGSG